MLVLFMEQALTETRLDELPLHPVLLQGLEKAGFSRCTPIQAATLPFALIGRDVAGQAQTGTGKTAAFLLALMDRLLRSSAASGRKANQPRAVVFAPTRELAIQIHKDALVLGSKTDLVFGLVYGGVDYDKQRNMLADGVDVLIGTPGRVIDYHKQRVFDMNHVEVMVLDEADRMFDLGFIKDIRYLLRRMPKPENRLSMLFSATLSMRVHELAYEHMDNPESIEIEPDKVTADTVTQLLYHVESSQKMSLLLGVLKQHDPSRTLIFINTKRVADKVTGYLLGNGFSCETLSGDVHQKKRQRLIGEFGSGKLAILVATDVAARGLHIPEVSHVINYDLPHNEEDYVHRIGRTARLGETGNAISLACEEYVYSLIEIENFIGHKIPTAQITDALLVEPKPPVHIKRPKRPMGKRAAGGKGSHLKRRGGGRKVVDGGR
mgnify:CR=1 FL=1